MREINLSANNLVSALLNLESNRHVCLLDSCGVSHLGSHLLIAGFSPVEILEINETSPEKTLSLLDAKIYQKDLAAILTISYDFGLKLNNIATRFKDFEKFADPDVFIALFDVLIIHDYDLHQTYLTGNEDKFDEIEKILLDAANSTDAKKSSNKSAGKISSNFTYNNYLSAVEKIQELIRQGATYQTNLTQQIRVETAGDSAAEEVFQNLRKDYPAPFASFLHRKNDVVISASPERFFKVDEAQSTEKAQNKDVPHSAFRVPQSQIISVSPIKGTRPRGKTFEEDTILRNELLQSEKDRAENVMIVDLLRNDIGRICEYGSVEVEKLCELEEHPTLFHLVSTVSGELRKNLKFSDILRAVFPCGSITGAPKIRTMQIIDRIETVPRGLSMGAIGFVGFDKTMDFSVAIRTIVMRKNEAVFNVGGGITIESVPAEEYAETLVKAKSLLKSLGARETI